MPKKEKDNPIISQSEAAKIANVSRQAISGMRKANSQYNFFTDSGSVDINSKDWKTYIADRKSKNGAGQGGNPTDNNLQVPGKKKSGDKSGKKKVLEIENHEDSGQIKYSTDHALTGGYDPAMFYPTNPSQLKSLTDIVAKNLEMRIKLGEYIHRDIVILYVEKISQEVQQIINLGRSVSQDICEKLDRLGQHTEVEKIINAKTEKLRDGIVNKCNSIRNIKVE